jgi:hypothetical protein
VPIHLPHPDEAKRQRSKIRELIDQLDNATIDRLLNRARHAATDAYAGGANAGSNTVSNPTEAAVIRNAGGRITHDDHGREIFTPDTWDEGSDPTRDAIAEFFAELAEAHGLIRRLARRQQYLSTDHERAIPRASTPAGNCQCCDTLCTGAVDDKLISGYCKKCRNAWEHAGYPDRVEFQRDHALKHPDTHGGPTADTEWDPTRHLGAHQYETTRATTGGS